MFLLGHSVYKISAKSDYISPKYGNITIFKMVVVRYLGFPNFENFHIRPSIFSDFGSAYKIGQTAAELWPKRWFPTWRPSSILNLKFQMFFIKSFSCDSVYEISPQSDHFSLRYVDITIFILAAVRDIGFVMTS